MVNNQNEFNNQYSKELKKIEIKRNRNFQGQLVIENYPELESLNLRDIRGIDKVILKNLTQLQECTIWDCSIKELIIDNCPQIKKLIVRSNLLTSLEFVKDLKNLEELDLYGNVGINSGLEHLSSSLKVLSYENTKLVEILKPYKGNWNSWKTVQKLTELAQQAPQELAKSFWDLEEEIKILKQKQPITLNNPLELEQKYQKLKSTINFLLKEETTKTQKINVLQSQPIITEELISKLKKQKDNLSEFQKSNQELQEKLSFYETVRDKIHQKEQEIIKLKQTIISINHLEEDDLEDILEAQIEFLQTNNSKRLERTKKKLVKIISEEEISNLCQLQEVIIKLQNNINQREQQINQIINNITVQQGHAFVGSTTIRDNANLSISNTQVETKIEIPPKNN